MGGWTEKERNVCKLACWMCQSPCLLLFFCLSCPFHFVPAITTNAREYTGMGEWAAARARVCVSVCVYVCVCVCATRVCDAISGGLPRLASPCSGRPWFGARPSFWSHAVQARWRGSSSCSSSHKSSSNNMAAAAPARNVLPPSHRPLRLLPPPPPLSPPPPLLSLLLLLLLQCRR